jgi:excinuclease UvrABC nuclease subunit
MKSINFPAFFDNFILAPTLKGSDITQWFKEHEKRNGVYTVFNKQFEPLYTGSSKDLRRRLWEHRSKDKLKDHLEEVLFIGIKYVEGNPTPKERQFIRELQPLLNVYRYQV